MGKSVMGRLYSKSLASTEKKVYMKYRPRSKFMPNLDQPSEEK